MAATYGSVLNVMATIFGWASTTCPETVGTGGRRAGYVLLAVPPSGSRQSSAVGPASAGPASSLSPASIEPASLSPASGTGRAWQLPERHCSDARQGLSSSQPASSTPATAQRPNRQNDSRGQSPSTKH